MVAGVEKPVESGRGGWSGDKSAVGLRMLGPLTISRDGFALPLPSSRKVRALVGYLALAPHAVTRSRLCELLWDAPNDPRGELRWCLSKVRRVLDEPGRRRVLTDGETVELDLTDCFVDVTEISRLIPECVEALTPEELRERCKLFAGDFLDGLEIDRSPEFGSWLLAQRHRYRSCHAALLEHLAKCVPRDEAYGFIEKWLELAPFDLGAHEALMNALAQSGRMREGDEHLAATVRLFEAEGLISAPIREIWRSARVRAMRLPSLPVYRDLPQGSAGVRPLPALPDKPSIAILPFENMSEVSGDIYFADGIAEDLITELSRYPDLFVIARNSSFIYRGKMARVTDAARELGVRYVLEGSVRRAGERIRVSAQLIEAESGRSLWAQRYDRDLNDLFAIQDEVVQSIVAVLPGRVHAAALDLASRKTTGSLDAYDHLLRGKYCHHLETVDANREAESHFDRSIELDPLFASAYAWKACALGQALACEFRPRTPEVLRQIGQLLDRAMSIDANNTECHRIMSRIALMQGQYAKSEHHLERALALNPNDPRLVVQRGINLTCLGDPEAAVPWIERAMRLDPSFSHRYYLDMARALFMAGRPAQATVILEQTARPHWEHYLWLAACYAAADKESAAKQAGQEALALRPGLSVATCIDAWFIWRRSEDRARLRDVLTRAGLPP